MLRIGDLLARRRRHGTAQPYDVIQMRSGWCCQTAARLGRELLHCC